MIDQKCPECGCTIPPDAARCPNCSYTYTDGAVKVPPKSNGNGITVSCVGFVTKCEVHGKIHIRANVASVPTRCPFCCYEITDKLTIIIRQIRYTIVII